MTGWCPVDIVNGSRANSDHDPLDESRTLPFFMY